MSKELLNLNVAHLNPSHIETGDPDSIHPVGASHLREYLNLMYGKEMPEGDEERQLADMLHQTLTNFSTTEDLMDVLQENPFDYIPYWLTLVRPIIDAESKTGKYLESRLEAMLARRGDPADPAEINNDFTYMLGMYDVTSFAIAGVVEIPHPRLENKELAERSSSLAPPGHQFQTERVGVGFEALARLPILSPAQKQELVGVMDTAKILIANSEQYIKAVKMILGEG